jgi:DNA-binding transcriptional MerR regulator
MEENSSQERGSSVEGYYRGQLAKKAAVNVETLRYYETYGLIPAPARTDAGYRVYSEDTLTRLEFIRMAKLCGFSLQQIKRLLTKAENRVVDLTYFSDVLERRIHNIEAEITELEKLKGVLVKVKQSLQETKKSSELHTVMQALNIE